VEISLSYTVAEADSMLIAIAKIKITRKKEPEMNSLIYCTREGRGGIKEHYEC